MTIGLCFTSNQPTNQSTRMAESESEPESMPWSPGSWRSKRISQNVVYPPETASKLEDVRRKLASMPPLVTSNEVRCELHRLA